MIDHESTYSKLFYLLNQGQTHSLERNGGGGGSLLGNVASCGLVLLFFLFLSQTFAATRFLQKPREPAVQMVFETRVRLDVTVEEESHGF
jgi:hypothetical protein